MTSSAGSYDALLFDLDGTLIRGKVELPYAVDAVAAARAGRVPIAVVTNNASRTPAEVAEQLTGAGFDIGPDEIVTSAQAGAGVLASSLEPDSEVLVVGTGALMAEVSAVGLRPVRESGARTAAVVQGHSPDTCWRDLAQACLAIRAGAEWVACNCDATLPTDAGELPGNGSMVAALMTATGRVPTVAGKPGRPLMDVAATRCGSSNPLVVGDRLNTDIAGAAALGADSLLVLTGVTGPAELLGSARVLCPTYVAEDLRALTDLEQARVGPRQGWSADVECGSITLSGGGDPWDALRVLCAASTGVAPGPVRIVGSGVEAQAALATLGLPESVDVVPDTVDPINPVRKDQR